MEHLHSAYLIANLVFVLQFQHIYSQLIWFVGIWYFPPGLVCFTKKYGNPGDLKRQGDQISLWKNCPMCIPASPLSKVICNLNFGIRWDTSANKKTDQRT
jgi:hypothetical protein